MVAIKTENLTKKYKERIAVDNLNLEVEQGVLLSLLGVNGAGKTTTIKMLSGLTAPSAGDAYILDNSITKCAIKAKHKLNISPQETAIAPLLTVRENLEFIAGIYGFEKQIAAKKADEMLVAFGLADRAKDKARRLSGGMQRRLSIAMALITDPEILFLDEPTLGLDVIARRELWNLIKNLKGKITIILTTHYMEEAEALSDIIAIMADGKLQALGTSEELIKRAETKNFEEAFIKIAGAGVKL